MIRAFSGKNIHHANTGSGHFGNRPKLLAIEPNSSFEMNLALEEVLDDADDGLTPTQGDHAYVKGAPIGLDEPIPMEFI